MSSREKIVKEIGRLREIVNELKKVEETAELKIGSILRKLSDIVDDLYYFIEQVPGHFYVRRCCSDRFVTVRGLSGEWTVSKPFSAPLSEIYNAFFNDEDMLIVMLSKLIDNLRELVKILQERLDITRLVSEAEKLIETLSEDQSDLFSISSAIFSCVYVSI
jgi:hypothetical protein